MARRKNNHIFVVRSGRVKARLMRRANYEDIMRIKKLLYFVKLDMEENNLPMWDKDYPTKEMIIDDIKNNGVFLYYEYDILKGMFARRRRMPGYMREVAFKPANKPVYISKICVHPKYRNVGHATRIFDFILRYAEVNQFDAIRCSIDKRDTISIEMFEEANFKRKKKIVDCYGKKHVVYEYNMNYEE